jgi:hypothetical protein
MRRNALNQSWLRFARLCDGYVIELGVADVVGLVERILAAKRAEQPSRKATACQAAAADVTAWEREIDERVYRLYGLTAAEIKIVEESSRKG